MLDWRMAGRHERRMLEVLKLVFRNHSKLLTFLFEADHPRLRRDPAALLSEAGALSSGERVLVRLALDLWNGNVGVRIWELIEELDESNFDAVLLGLRHLRRNEAEGAPMRWRQLKFPTREAAPMKNGQPPAPEVCRR
jgi:hypothetical protein